MSNTVSYHSAPAKIVEEAIKESVRLNYFVVIYDNLGLPDEGYKVNTGQVKVHSGQIQPKQVQSEREKSVQGQWGQKFALWTAVRPCWLGWVAITATEQGIQAIALADSPTDLADLTPQPTSFPSTEPSAAQFQTWVSQVLALIEMPTQTHNLPLQIQGTEFQQRVWQLLRGIPPGTTRTYRELAQQMNHPNAVRAVARACATNSLAVAIPCHRVVGSDRTLKGYRWGTERKLALLEREGLQPAQFR